MEKQKVISKYKTNKAIRKKIDKLLHKNSIIQSSLGTESTLEEKEIARKATKDIAHSIYEICPIFAKDNFLEIEFDEVL